MASQIQPRTDKDYTKILAPLRSHFTFAFRGQAEPATLFETFEASLKDQFTRIKLADTVTSFSTKFNEMYDKGRLVETVGYLASMKSGVFFRKDSTYQFNTFITSSIEYGSGNHESATFVTGGLFLPLNAQVLDATGKFGFGASFGDPNHLVGTVNFGTYISPDALDYSGGLSFGQISRKHKYPHPSQRTVMDHIRPVDTWFTVSLRQLSGSTSKALLPNATIAEADLTWALETHNCSLAAPTFSLSGIYCVNKAVGIDELGLEYRTPINDSINPVFLAARFGTRGQYTFSFNMRF